MCKLKGNKISETPQTRSLSTNFLFQVKALPTTIMKFFRCCILCTISHQHNANRQKVYHFSIVCKQKCCNGGEDLRRLHSSGDAWPGQSHAHRGKPWNWQNWHLKMLNGWNFQPVKFHFFMRPSACNLDWTAESSSCFCESLFLRHQRDCLSKILQLNHFWHFLAWVFHIWVNRLLTRTFVETYFFQRVHWISQLLVLLVLGNFVSLSPVQKVTYFEGIGEKGLYW